MTIERIADIVPPGTHLKREMQARGWSQADLAEILGRPLQAVNQILKGKKAITPNTSQELEDATAISAATWLALESAYRLSLEGKHNSAVAERARLFSRAPLADMRRRGWIRDTRNIAELRQDVMRLLRIESLDERPRLAFAARKATSYGDVLPEQEAWCCRAFQIAESIKGVPKFSAKRFESGLRELRQLCDRVETLDKIPSLLHNFGIRFLVVEHLPRTKIDGATFWLSKDRPVVVVSLRYGRVDHFLFTLFHELMHVRHGDAVSLDNDLVPNSGDGGLPEWEVRANQEAAAILVPPDKLARFVAQGRISRSAIIDFSRRVTIHPGVVLGQLQHRGIVGWSTCRDLLVPVRDKIVQSARTDGWQSAGN